MIKCRIFNACALSTIILTLSYTPLALSNPRANANNYWAESPLTNSGASSTMFNAAAGLPWKNIDGDWIDKDGIEQGTNPYATFTASHPGEVLVDISLLIQHYAAGIVNNRGIYIKGSKNSGVGNFYSREYKKEEQQPYIDILTSKGKDIRIFATADTHLDPSTHRSLGSKTILKLTPSRSPILIFFPLFDLPSGEKISKATLHLYLQKRYGNKAVSGEIYACQPGGIGIKQITKLGIAAEKSYDKGLSTNPSVILTEFFEDSNWRSNWSETEGTIRATNAEANLPLLDGKALQIMFKKGAKLGANISFKFNEKIGSEPDSIFFRYYILLANNWSPSVGGKLPGIAGTYGKAGWGGRKADGYNGWSTRGSFKVPLNKDNPLQGLTPIGTYAYTGDMSEKYGVNWPWAIGQNGLLKRGEWYCIEQHVVLNTPGINNGVLKTWVNGKLAFEKNDILYRNTNELKIDRIWINFYHGGTTTIPTDQEIYIDNIVISNKYIGPMKKD